jgi:hypothetical protein
MVDMAGSDWSLARRSPLLQVDRPMYRRDCRCVHYTAALVTPRRFARQASHVGETLFRKSPVPHRYSHLVLHDHVRAAFRNPRKFGRRDNFMSSEFRQTLGHGMPDTYAGASLSVVKDNVVDNTLRHRSWFRGVYPSFEHPRRLPPLSSACLSRWKWTYVVLRH